jgi:hypothetical protein
LLFPTTTKALKLNLLPPLTTLATRLMWATRSTSSSSSGFICAKTLPPVQAFGDQLSAFSMILLADR